MANLSDSAFSDQEIVFLRELHHLGLRYILVGAGAAVVQGANTMTQDLDFWLDDNASPHIAAAAKAAGGFYSSRMQPPMVGGAGLDRIDLVTHCDGLGSFEQEYANTIALPMQDFEIRVLNLERVIASKIAANRPKDRAVLEQLRAALVVLESVERNSKK